MHGCRINHPEEVSPDVSRAPSVWPAGWSVEIDQDGGATLQIQALPILSELLKELASAAADAQEFEFILQRILDPGAQPDTTERLKARREISKSQWYDTIYERFGDEFSVDTLSTIFQVVVIPDLPNSAIANEIADWARYMPPAVIGGLLAAAKISGDAPSRLMMDILKPALADRWATERRIGKTRDSVARREGVTQALQVAPEDAESNDTCQSTAAMDASADVGGEIAARAGRLSGRGRDG